MPEMNSPPIEPNVKRRGQWLRRLPLYLVSFVLVPVALLGLVELGLRAAGFGYSTRFFLHRSFDGTGFSVTNKAFYQQFFSLPIDHIWEGSEWQVPDIKPERTCRVFVLGSSAAQGWPDPAYSFWRILDLMLRDAYPELRFEVYSAAHPGVNSNVMLPVARACAGVEPDLFVVYMGNNEVNGPYGAVNASGGRAQWGLPYIRARIALTDLRLLQLATGNSNKPWRSTIKAVEQYFALDDPRLNVVGDHFAANLEDICTAAERSGAGLVLCTVGAALKDWWPHDLPHRPDLPQDKIAERDQACQAGAVQEEQKNWPAAAEAYARALAIDAANAELHYRMGRCQYALEEYDQARGHFEQAYELDAMRSRIFPALNTVIEKTAAKFPPDAVRLAPAAGELVRQSPHQIPGREFFFDDCHLTFEGNYVVASTVFQQVQPLLARRFPDLRPAGATPTLGACRERLALTPAVLKEHLRTFLNSASQWKWKTRPELAEQMMTLDREAGPDWVRTNAESYRVALEKSPGDYYLRLRRVEALLLLNDGAAALDEARKLVQYYPYRRDTRRALGAALARCGRIDEAVREFGAVLRLYPDDAETCLQLGLAQAQAKRPEEARKAFRAALTFDPSNEKAKCGEARLLQDQGDMAGARRAFREAIVLNPRAPEAYEGLDAALQAAGDPAQRAAEWQAVAKELPDSARVCFLLGGALLAAQQPKEAEQAYRKAVALDPFDTAMQVQLGNVLEQVGNNDGALEQYRGIVRKLPDAAIPSDRIDAIYAARGDMQGRLAEWRAVVERYPQARVPRLHLAAALTDIGDPGAAADAYRALLAQAPDDSEAQLGLAAALACGGETPAALDTLRALAPVKAGQENAAAATLDRIAKVLLERAETQAAVEVLSRSVALEPDNFQHTMLLAGVLEQLGDNDGALGLYRRIVQKMPDAANSSDRIDAIHEARGDTQARLAEWRAMVERHPQARVPRLHLAAALTEAGEAEAAADTCRALLAEAPDDSEAQLGLAAALAGGGGVPAALDTLRALAPVKAGRESAAAAALDRIAKVLLERAETQAAAEVLSKSVALEPANFQHAMLLAAVLEQLGDKDGALRQYRAIVLALPESPKSSDRIDAIHAERGDGGERVAEWRTIAEKHPEAVNPWRRLADALDSTGDRDSASEARKRADKNAEKAAS